MFPGDLTEKMPRIFLKPRFPSQVTIDGEDVENMNQLVRQVAYLNTRGFNFKNTIMFFTVNLCQHNSNNNGDNNNNDNDFHSGRFLN